MSSVWYTNLQREIVRLDTTYLPQGTRPPHQLPSEEERERIRAYFVFAHAAIEAYIEDRSREVARSAFEVFRSMGSIRRSLLAMVTHCVPVRTADDILRIRNKKDEPLLETLHKIVRQYEDTINKNHGIRRDNLSALLGPIGIELSRIDDVWLSTIDTFGNKRGIAAHLPGSAFAAKYQPSIDDARKEVHYLVCGQANAFPGLQEIDAAFDGL